MSLKPIMNKNSRETKQIPIVNIQSKIFGFNSIFYHFTVLDFMIEQINCRRNQQHCPLLSYWNNAKKELNHLQPTVVPDVVDRTKLTLVSVSIFVCTYDTLSSAVIY
jgi:hypothetical protein